MKKKNVKCVQSKNEDKSRHERLCSANCLPRQWTWRAALNSNSCSSQKPCLAKKSFFRSAFSVRKESKTSEGRRFLMQVCFHLSMRLCDTVSRFLDFRDLFFSHFDCFALNQIFEDSSKRSKKCFIPALSGRVAAALASVACD